ncbi:hypothetical protein TRFO_01381 [Tritrichomonas foetus]|uniref:c-Myc-binding protein n=1 Tax=Tritrichomonas foetus TaxID=1144522 RepID=A0A1J4K7P1_9EUKA|nr:hypothetical protein TRFO_01381 [Tritrichomonas foetus]|eukprot:OHT07219.1 hypothetical protein TRFO_01381 [Tritrichomonas foetus]
MNQTTADLPTPPKRDSFRKYLDDGGVIDSITRVLVNLYEQQQIPEDLLSYVRQFLGSPQGVNVESLKQENEKLKEEHERLEKRLQELKTQLGISE